LASDESGKPAGGSSRVGTRAFAAPFLVAAVSFCFQLPFFDRWFGVMDEGHMLQFADVVASGGMLYRDATSYPLPGAFYLLALAFQVFEPSILLSRWLIVLEFTVFVVAIFLIMRRVTSPAYAAISVALLLLYRVWAFPHWQMYSYSTTALTIFSLTLLVLLRFLDTGNRRFLAGAGLLYGLGVFCKQDYGAATLLAVVITLGVYARGGPRELRRPLLPLLATFLGPAALVGAAAGVHFWMQGQLGFVVQLTVLNHFVGLSTFDYQAFPPLLPLFEKDPALRTPIGLYAFFPAIISTAEGTAAFETAMVARTALYDTAVKLYIYSPNALVIVGAFCLWRKRSALAAPQTRPQFVAEALVLATAAAFALLISVYKPQDYVHLAVLYWAFICLAVAVTHSLLKRRASLTRVVAALALIPTVAMAGYTGRLVWKFRELHSELIPGERAGVFAKPEEARLLGELTDYVRANSAPDETVAAMPYFPILQFLANRDAPHASSYILWPFPEYPDRDSLIIEAMEESKTPLVVYSFTQFPNFPPVPSYAPDLFEYLVDNFEMKQVFNDVAFGYKLAALERQSTPPEGTFVLGEAGGEGSLRVEVRGGASREISADARGKWIEAGDWPFRSVVALRPVSGDRRSVLSIPIEIPSAGARLETSIGVHPDLWFRSPPSWVRFEVEVVSDGRRAVLFDRALDPQQVLEDRGWFAVDVPLDEYRGRNITLEFATSTAWPTAENPRMGGWGAPLLVPRKASSSQ
jgi:hypothetical protein